MKYLFICIPPNSGSTLVAKHIEACREAIVLPKEGAAYWGSIGRWRHFKKWHGPRPLNFCTRGFMTDDWVFDPQAFNWDVISERWHAAWHKADPRLYRLGRGVLVAKDPYNVAFADQLYSEFGDVRLLFSIRDPYATIEGMLRRRRWWCPRATSEYIKGLAWHWVACAERIQQYRSLYPLSGFFYRYEDLCADPEHAAGMIRTLLPELPDLDFGGTVDAPNVLKQPMPVTNLNRYSMRRLDARKIAAISSVLKKRTKLMERLGYEIL